MMDFSKDKSFDLNPIIFNPMFCCCFRNVDKIAIASSRAIHALALILY